MESLFRFMTLRPPEEVELDNSNFVITENPNSEYQQVLHGVIQEVGHANALEHLIGMTREFMASENYWTNLNQIAIPLREFGDVLTQTSPQNLEDLKNLVRQVFPDDAIQLVNSQEFLEARSNIADSIIALSIVPAQEGDEYFYQELLQGIRLCALLERIATEDVTLDNEWVIAKALTQIVLLPDSIFPLSAPLAQTEIRVNGSIIHQLEAEQQPDNQLLVEKLGNLRTALDELSNLKASDFKQVDYLQAESKVKLQPDTVTVLAEPTPWLLSEKAIDHLSETTLAEIKALNLDLDTVALPEITNILEKELIEVGSEIYTAPEPTELVQIGTNYMPLTEVVGKADISAVLEYANTGAFRAIGYCDLYVVKQELQRYEAKEIAHIENVLQEEEKERTHRRAKRTEETYLVETEKTETTEKDLQSSERFELQQQTQETIKEDSQFSVDVTVKYGGVVDVTANTKYGTQQSSQKSQQSATSYARDITNRSVSRIEERIREQRVQKLIQEIEEKNLHRLKATNEHIVGIYRWVDKVYKAQIYNYGDRLMFEFIVPEPAAFTYYAQAKRKASTIKEPKEPLFGPKELKWDRTNNKWVWVNLNKEEPLRPHHITWWNYQQWVVQYKVTGVEPPPPSQITKAETYKSSSPSLSVQDEQDKNFIQEGEATNISLPNGYKAKKAHIVVFFSPDKRFDERRFLQPWQIDDLNTVNLVIGRHYMQTGVNRISHGWIINLDEEVGEIPFVIQASHNCMVSVSIEIILERSKELMQKWQQKTYDAIITAYLNLKSEYEEQLAAASIEEGVAISGRNPALNRELEKTELKKGALTLLTRKTSPHFDYVGSIDVIEKDVTDKYGLKKIKGHPEINFAEADREGPYIQFFEQAFEWPQMTYIFYPYFWARKQLWATLQQIEDNDPLHAQFLQAGAARVLVPVRRGYEDAIQYYLSTNKIAGPPGIGSKRYVPLVTAIKEQQGIDFSKREGTISVTKDSKDVTGQDTKFIPDDVDREIVIKHKKYRIAKVESSTKLKLSENYTGETDNQVPYSIGLKLVGEPWEVKIPTSLVYLQQDKTKLPDFTDE